MKKFLLGAAIVAALFCGPAQAQNPGSVTNHAFAVGKGSGTTGYTSLLCTAAQFAVGQAATDPICEAITGDITIDATGNSTIGAAKVVNAKLGPDVFSTAHTWSGVQTFTSPVLNNPTISGTVAGGATYTNPTLTNPTLNGTVAGAVTSAQTSGGVAITVSGTCTITSSGTCTINLDKASQANIFAAVSNKGMTADNMYTAEIAVTYGATTTFDFSTFINGAVTLTGNISTMTLNNVKAGQAGQIRFIQDATGGRTTVWNSIFKFVGGTTPVLSLVGGTIDVLFYSCVSSSLCYASLSANMK